MNTPRDLVPPDETVGSGDTLSLAQQASASVGFREGDLLSDRYRIERFLARGGMGEVYRAHDLELGVPVALKTIRPEIATDPAALRSFKQEVLTARSVTHANVCRIYDLGRHRDETRDVSFLTMEFLPGETLSSRLRRVGRLSGADALPIVRQLAEGLDAAHGAGIVHRDFKSANVMLAPDDAGRERAVITDFGLAVRSRASGVDEGAETGAGVETEAFTGTPAYMSPEQVRGETLGPASDLYSLGIVLYEMTTGHVPFEGDNPIGLALARLSTAPSAPSVFAPVEPVWEQSILKLLSVDPAGRFPTARDLVRTLEGRARAETRARHSLPPELDAFVGRREVLSSLSGALEPSAALVTLLGVGGTGKTRLARRYGWESLERWPGGVWFCDLTDASDVNGIASAVANALDVTLGKGDPIVQLGDAIAGLGRALVILDNFEQIAAHAEATVGRWRSQAQKASLLVTTRERLQLSGESVVEVEPLDPDSEAIELLEERARAQRPGFAVTPENRTIAIEIVRMLDGLPLAIELAAARLRMLSIEQLRERLSDRFSVLSSSKRGRHGALRAALDWSWSLLTPWEQSAAAQASVFQGGFTLEAAEAVIDLSVHADAPMVIDVIQSLLDKSWLRARVAHAAPRFSMYATVQEYTAEKLRAGGEETADLRSAVTRHGAFFAGLLKQPGDPKGRGARRVALRLDLDNLIAACRAAIGRGDEEVSVAAYLLAAPVLEMRGPLLASLELGESVLSAVRSSRLTGHVLFTLAKAERATGSLREARAHYEAALSFHRDAGERHREGGVLLSLGVLCFDEGRWDEARTHYEAALAIFRETGSRTNEGFALANLGNLALVCGRPDVSRSHFTIALSIHREIGDRLQEATVLGSLGTLELLVGRMEEARSHYEAALSIHREFGDRRSEGRVRGQLGDLARREGQQPQARSHLQAAIEIHREVGNRHLEGVGLGNLGEVDWAEGLLDDASTRLAAAVELHRDVGNVSFQGSTLGSLGQLHAEAGRWDESARCFTDGERLLREISDQVQLGLLLCRRGRSELLRGEAAAARSTLSEAEQIVESIGGGDESELARAVMDLRRVLATRQDPRV